MERLRTICVGHVEPPRLHYLYCLPCVSRNLSSHLTFDHLFLRCGSPIYRKRVGLGFCSILQPREFVCTSTTSGSSNNRGGFNRDLCLCESIERPNRHAVAQASCPLLVTCSGDLTTYSSYNSRKETGHIGLRGQDASCMNAVLQSLFCIDSFGKVLVRLLPPPRPPS